MEIKRSVCPYDCPDACGLLVQVQDGQVVKVQGDPEHPFTRGTLCSKMLHYERTVHSPLRLTQPLLRTGPKGAGEFKPISWEEAIERIAANWQRICQTYGAEAILPCSYAGTMGVIQRSSGHPFFHRLGASRLLRTLCSPAKEYGWKAVMGSTPAPHPDEVRHSDLVILWGTNTLATNIHFLHGLKAAKKCGAKVWLIDTYQTPAAAIADRVFLVRPGSDGALALSLMNILARDGLIDRDFINTYVQGFSELQAQILPEYPPELVAGLTGVAAETIEEMAHLYAQARAPFIRIGSGLSRYGNGAMTIRTITCLPALVGAWAKPGGGALGDISTGSALAASIVTREDLMAKPTRTININQLGHALNHLSDPPIMSLYVYHSNPASVFPDQNSVLNGLSREDLFTVVHERFMTDTARYGDIVLPATTSLEHSDIYRAYGHYCIQRAAAAIAPVGQARSNWQVFALLAQALGFTEPCFAQQPDQLIEQMLSASKGWLSETDLTELREGRTVELTLPPDYKLVYQTPSGKIELLNLAETETLPRYIKPNGDNGVGVNGAISDNGSPFWLMSTPGLYSLNSSFNERPDLLDKRGVMSLEMNALDAEAKGLVDGQQVVAFNQQGEVDFTLKISPQVPKGVVVAEGVWGLDQAPGPRTVNALTSQRLTDRAAGSTFYDTKVDVRRA
jgi:anaerobic selenocysteine-containing dehydrogenase